MKLTILFLIFFFNCTSVNSQSKNQISSILVDITTNSPYNKLTINPLSFIPELNDELKKDENFQYTMKEVNEKNFDEYFKKIKKTELLNWTKFGVNKLNFPNSHYELQISSPIFIKNNTEALIQVKTGFSNWFQIYKCTNNKCTLSYAFGNKKLPKEKGIK